MQVKSYFEGQIRTLGQNMDALMARLWEEHLRPRGRSRTDRHFYPDRAEQAPRGPFGGYYLEPSGVSEASTTGQA